MKDIISTTSDVRTERNAVSLDDCTMVMQESISVAGVREYMVKRYGLGNVGEGYRRVLYTLLISIVILKLV